MAQAAWKKWGIRAGAAIIVILSGVGAWAATNASLLKARFEAYQLLRAGSDAERASLADKLLSLGPVGMSQLAKTIRTGDASCRSASTAAIERSLAAASEGDPNAQLLAGYVLAEFPQCDEAGQRSILGLLTLILKRTGTTYTAQCRNAALAGLKLNNPEARLLAIQLALHPDLNMRAELLPLVNDPLPRIRGAALFGVGSAIGETLISDEELFRFLHDPDEGVRKVCYDALVGRDRTEKEIALARRLLHPDPSERLKLLLDLRYEEEIADPEPWLERLSRDQEPAVRAGAARVVLEVSAERKQSCPRWLSRVVDGDPDPTVRRVGMYFRKEWQQTGGEVRTAGGP